MANEEPEKTRVVLTEREIDEEDIRELIRHILRVSNDLDTRAQEAQEQEPELNHPLRAKLPDILKQLILDINELSQKIVVYIEAYDVNADDIPDDFVEEWERIMEMNNGIYFPLYNNYVEMNPDLEPEHVVFGSGKPKRQLNGYKINVRLVGAGLLDDFKKRQSRGKTLSD